MWTNWGYFRTGSVMAGFGLRMGSDSMGVPSVQERNMRQSAMIKQLEGKVGMKSSTSTRNLAKTVAQELELSQEKDMIPESVQEIESELASVKRDKDSKPRGMWPKPNNWESLRFGDIRHHFKCKVYAHDQTKPLPTIEDWTMFQSKYKDNVDKTAKFEDPVLPTMGYTIGDGGPPPFYAKHSLDGRGRGLFASRNIKKGELVHDGTTSDVLFPDAMTWRHFIFSLPRNKACDMIDWTWTQKTEEDGAFKIFSAINISILFNSGGSTSSNVNPRSSTSSKFYATREVAMGEELLCTYGLYDTVWRKVGL